MKPLFPLCMVLVLALASACATRRAAEKIEEAELRYQVAEQLLARGETTQATSELLKAERLNPRDPQIQHLLGLAFINKEDLGVAEDYFRRAIRLDSSFSEAHNNLGALLIRLKRFDEAIQHCTRAAENVVYATPERAYHNIGVAQLEMGRTDEAVTAFNRALIHNANFVMSLKMLGKNSLKADRVKEGVGFLNRASHACRIAEPGSWGLECPEVHYELARGHVRLRQRSEAVAALKRCIEEDSEGEYGRKCQSDLKILK